MPSPNRRRSLVLASAGLIIAIGLALAVHANSTTTRCYPTPMTVRPSSVAPGDTFRLSSTGGCPAGAKTDARATVLLSYSGAVDAPPSPTPTALARVDVSSTGAFTADLHLPADAPMGQSAQVRLEPYLYAPCPHGADCAPPGAGFRIAPNGGSGGRPGP